MKGDKKVPRQIHEGENQWGKCFRESLRQIQKSTDLSLKRRSVKNAKRQANKAVCDNLSHC